jgi:hypothetical protein
MNNKISNNDYTNELLTYHALKKNTTPLNNFINELILSV